MKRLLQSLFIFMCISVSAMAQDRTVTGTVKGGDDGLPIPGATVRIKESPSVGTQTGADGKFSLKVPATSKTLLISFLGYANKEVAITDGVIAVTLSADNKSLNEVVVTANAIKREKRSLGYAATTITSDVLVQGGSASPLTAMVGRVAGMNISSSSNTPGSSTRIVFRGGSSISGNNQALIVIDGVPVDNSSVTGGADSRSSADFGNRANDIDPDDIESITPLLGPAAAALYGSRASNGAVQITTKSGKKGKTQVTFNTSNTFSSILKLPDFQNEYGQGYYSKLDDNGIISEYFNDSQENWSWGAPFTGQLQEWGQSIDGVRQMKPYEAQRDNVRNFFKTGFATDNNLSFSGGNEKSTFYLALNTLNSDGIFPGMQDVYNKYGVRFNGKTDFSEKFSAGISFNYNRIDARQIAGGQNDNSVFDNVLQTPRDIPLDKLSDLTNKYNGYGYTDANGVVRSDKYGYYGSYAYNPYFIIENFVNDDVLNRITGNVNLEYKPVSWLNIQNRIGTDTYAERRRQLTPKFSFSPIDEDTNQSDRISNGGYQIDQFNVTELVNDLMVTATHSFNPDFKGSLMVGNNIRQRNTTTSRTATNASAGLVVPNWYNLQNSNGPLNVITDNISNRRLVGLYADLNLSYKNFLFLQATARNDWSSTLPVQNNSFFYPSVSGSFVFSELIKPNNILSYGKIRASVAKVGNDTDPYQLLTTFARGTINGNFGSTIFPFGNVAALQAGTTLGNANLKPEITTAYEIGTELSFLDNRLGLDFTYYQNRSKNQILAIPIPNSTGYGFSVINAGEVQNKGIELALKGTPIKTKNLNVELFGTFYKNNNTVVDLAPGVEQFVIGGVGGMSIVAAKGKTYGEFYAVTNQTDAQGRTIVDAETGLPLATTTAQYLGSYNPKYQASFGTSITINQHLNVNVLFDMKHGNKLFSRTKDILAFVGVSAETGGQRTGVPFPNSVYLDDDGNSVVNTDVFYNKQDYYPDLNPGMNIIDGSFVKMRSAGISYSFNKSQLKTLPFSNLSVGLFGNNLFIWTAKENKYVDPEVNSGGATNEQGFDYTAQPSVRNYGFNVKVTF
jgi:TonB-linked SusC/RagA family outer membrane protein